MYNKLWASGQGLQASVMSLDIHCQRYREPLEQSPLHLEDAMTEPRDAVHSPGHGVQKRGLVRAEQNDFRNILTTSTSMI